MTSAARGALVALACLARTVCQAQSTSPDNQVFGYLGIGHSFKVLGAQAAREGEELGIQCVTYEPKLARFKEHFRPVETLYVLRHKGSDQVYGSTQTYALGGMYGLRVLLGPGGRYFAEYSFGLQFESRRSYGLPSEANVTPAFLFGEVIGGRRPVEIALQLMHVSNGYTQQPNFGQDFAMILVGFKI